MPKVNNDEDVFNAHLLELGKQLLTAAFFVTVVVPFNYVAVVLARVKALSALIAILLACVFLC